LAIQAKLTPPVGTALVTLPFPLAFALRVWLRPTRSVLSGARPRTAGGPSASMMPRNRVQGAPGRRQGNRALLPAWAFDVTRISKSTY